MSVGAGKPAAKANTVRRCVGLWLPCALFAGPLVLSAHAQGWPSQQQQQPQQQGGWPQQQQPPQQQGGWPQQQQPPQQQGGWPQQQQGGWPQQQPQGGWPQQQPQGYPQQQYQQQPPAGQQGAQGAEGEAGEEAEAQPGTAYTLVSFGVGATQRLVTFGSSLGDRRLDTGFVPALHMRIDAGVAHQSFSFGGVLRYETSVAAKAADVTPDAKASDYPIRTHHFQLGLLPKFLFGDGPSGVSLGLFIGYGLRAFASDVELRVPRYTLHGPLFRPELQIPIGDVTLRLAVEGQYVLSISHDLRKAGSLKPSGFAVGGDAGLSVQVAEWLMLDAIYRESHAFAGSFWPTSLEDVERFVILGGTAHFF